MKLKFLPYDNLESLKNNIEDNLYLYNNPDNQWVNNFFGGSSPFRNFKKEVPDFKLEMDSDKPETTDITNAKIIYKSLIGLTDIQAGNERLWAGLAHGTFYEYMNYRWGTEKPNTVMNIKSRYFFAHGKRRSLVTNTLSRLWWLGRYTYDVQYEDPFKLINFFSNDLGTKSLYMFSSNFSSNEKIRKALLIAVNGFESKGVKIDRNKFKQIIGYLNVLGGTSLLDYYSKQELINIIEEYAEKILKLRPDNEIKYAALTGYN